MKRKAKETDDTKRRRSPRLVDSKRNLAHKDTFADIPTNLPPSENSRIAAVEPRRQSRLRFCKKNRLACTDKVDRHHADCLSHLITNEWGYRDDNLLRALMQLLPIIPRDVLTIITDYMIACRIKELEMTSIKCLFEKFASRAILDASHHEYPAHHILPSDLLVFFNRSKTIGFYIRVTYKCSPHQGKSKDVDVEFKGGVIRGADLVQQKCIALDRFCTTWCDSFISYPYVVKEFFYRVAHCIIPEPKKLMEDIFTEFDKFLSNENFRVLLWSPVKQPKYSTELMTAKVKSSEHTVGFIASLLPTLVSIDVNN